MADHVLLKLLMDKALVQLTHLLQLKNRDGGECQQELFLDAQISQPLLLARSLGSL
jgi:hypothetical protein